MQQKLKFEVIRAQDIPIDLQTVIHALFDPAYEQDLKPLFATFRDATHVLGFWGTTLASQAMWVNR